MSAYTRQKAKSKYRNRIPLERAPQEQSNGTNKTPCGGVMQCRERKRMNATERINDGASTSAAGAVEIMQTDDEIASIIDTGLCRHQLRTMVIYEDILGNTASARFTTTFVNNSFGHKCDVSDRLWFPRSLKPTKEKHLPLLNNTFLEELVVNFKLCPTCKNSLDSDKFPYFYVRTDLCIHLRNTGWPR
ncbi:uncharacterized protein TNCV_1147251 [Trichonephila clavipes]|nr:uncharacterized protein TNCV_1147251 [Trichonephila clavipes]